MRAIAVASDARVEAYAAFRDLPELARRELVALGVASQDREARLLLEIAIRMASQSGALAVTIPRIATEEVSWTQLESLGFQKGRTYTRYALELAP